MRAPRYALRLPVRYRPLGQEDWRDGLTENISSSGVLFRASELLDVNTPLELNIRLAPDTGVRVWPGEIRGLGHVVRTEAADAPDKQPAMAATIFNYQLARH